MAGTVQGKSLAKKEKKQVLNYEDTIAMVNLDEGIMQKGNLINYGAELIDKIDADKKVTGLSDARTGISTGEYSAYIIIPNTFSENIISLNVQPVKSTLTYTIGSEVEGKQREEIIYRVVDMYQTFSNNLSQIYISSVLGEVHEIQDSADEILKRDTADMEKLSAISGYDLLELVEIPDIREIERPMTPLNLTEIYEANRSGINNIGEAYQGYLSKGQQDFSVIQGEAVTLEEKAGDVQTSLEALQQKIQNTAIDEIDDTDRTAAEDLVYITQRDIVVGALDTYNKHLGQFNTSVQEQVNQYHYIENKYSDTVSKLSPFLDKDKTIKTIHPIPDQNGMSQSTIDMTEKTHYMHSVGQMDALKDLFVENLKKVDRKVISLGGTSVLSKNETYDKYVENLIQSKKSKGIDLDPFVIDTAVPDHLIERPKVTIDGIDYDQMPEVNRNEVVAAIETMITEAKKGRQERNNEQDIQLKTLHGEYDSLTTSLTGAYEVLETQQKTLETGLSGFDFLSYINNDEVDGFFTGLETNTKNLEGKVAEQTEGYENHINNVYENTNENVSLLQQAIIDGQKASNTKLEEGLSEAKTSKSDTNQKNTEVLEDFTKRLPYTRIGELENKEIYSFISEPIVLENVSYETNKAQETVVKDNSEVMQKESSDYLWIWIVGILVLVLILMAGSGIVFKKIRKPEEL